jgi:hypothetical protein
MRIAVTSISAVSWGFVQALFCFVSSAPARVCNSQQSTFRHWPGDRVEERITSTSCSYANPIGVRVPGALHLQCIASVLSVAVIVIAIVNAI